MINVLIPTKPDDTHAIYVKLALQDRGHEAMLWYTSDFPEKQTHSFELSTNKISWEATGHDFQINNNLFDVVWFRRPRRPVLSEFTHPEDRENSENENLEFYKTWWQVIAPDACWINPINRIKAVNCKLQQLKVAKEVGLNIPQTLISNDPEKIKLFISHYRNKGVIYKTLYPVFWINENDIRLTYTKEVRLEDLPSDPTLQSTAGIYQTKIPKAFELRVTYFGNQYLAAKLRSQEHPKGIMDWRAAPADELVIEPYVLPAEIDQKCQKLMKKLGIVFGCFDFIVSPEGVYYFLEVNEQGQFLWVEEVNPSIKMLDAFTNFIIQSSVKNNVEQSKKPISLVDFKSAAIAMQAEAMKVHKKPETFF